MLNHRKQKQRHRIGGTVAARVLTVAVMNRRGELLLCSKKEAVF